jgi:hypothetical protein
MGGLIWLAVVLAVIWVVAVVFFKVVGVFIHILLIVAVLAFIFWMVRRIF